MSTNTVPDFARVSSVDAGTPNAQNKSLPTIIQGGMGVAVSSWRLARAVSQTGQLGVVSGTALDTVVARRLQDGDAGGHIRRALEHFPVLPMAQRVLRRYFRAAGRIHDQPYILVPQLSLHPSTAALELSIVANFAEVWLAKDGHDGVVGINYLEKVQMATPSAAYGAMLADVDYVLMGAGIPAEIPQLLNHLVNHEPCSLKVHVDQSTTAYSIGFDPQILTGGGLAPLRRPMFLAIVSAHTLAAYLAREEATRPDGFVVEGPRSGGHNAPPRGHLVLDEDGQPVFGPRDDADFDKVAKIGLPFWLAGGYSTPEQLKQAQLLGAAGIQVGTLFALSAESGFSTVIRQELLTQLSTERLMVRTDPLASPTGFPFKVASLPGTLSEMETYSARPRLCDLGYLRVPYQRASGSIGHRCPGEPIRNYVRKGGVIDETVGRKCLCNGLMASVGLGQTRSNGYRELPLVTLGANFGGAIEMNTIFPEGWTAAKVVSYLLQ